MEDISGEKTEEDWLKNENSLDFEFSRLPGAVEDPDHQERVLSAGSKDYFQQHTHWISKLSWIICQPFLISYLNNKN